jgi:hypothetical protein
MRGNGINQKCQHGRIRAVAENENNRSLSPTGNKAFPTVDVSAGTEMRASVLPPARGLAAAEQQRGDATMSGKLKMGRVKDGPTLPRGVSADQLRRGGDGPWVKRR